MNRVILTYRYNKIKHEINSFWDGFILKSSLNTTKKNRVCQNLLSNEAGYKKMESHLTKIKLKQKTILNSDEWYEIFEYF